MFDKSLLSFVESFGRFENDKDGMRDEAKGQNNNERGDYES